MPGRMSAGDIAWTAHRQLGGTNRLPVGDIILTVQLPGSNPRAHWSHVQQLHDNCLRWSSGRWRRTIDKDRKPRRSRRRRTCRVPSSMENRVPSDGDQPYEYAGERKMPPEPGLHGAQIHDREPKQWIWDSTVRWDDIRIGHCCSTEPVRMTKKPCICPAATLSTGSSGYGQPWREGVLQVRRHRSEGHPYSAVKWPNGLG